MIAQEIIDNWNSTTIGHAAEITSLFEMGFPSWVVKTPNGYGVALPLPEGVEVYEKFSGATLSNSTMVLDGEEEQNVLLLQTDLEEIQEPFANLCAELLVPGNNGEFRDEVSKNPLSWWRQWKELLGNRNVDDTVYDVLGELCVLYYLVKRGEPAIWNGPDASIYDIDADQLFYEVKSTTSRKKKQITLSNAFQLDPPGNKGLKLVLCQFEPAQSGYSINELVEKLIQSGYSKDDLNRKLEKQGFERRKSDRNRCYDLIGMTLFDVDEEFPAIRKSSFVQGDFPKGVESITYTVSLDGITGTNLLVE